MKINYPLLGLLNILLFLIYVHNNIINFGGSGTSKYELITFFSIGLYLVWKVLIKKNIVINTSFKFIIMFFTYFLLVILIEFDNISRLKEYTVGSTGGVYFSYLVGLILSISTSTMFQVKNIRLTNMNISIFLLIFTSLTHNIQINALSNVNNILFIIEDLEGNYQRSGSFISILFILLSVITLKAIYLNFIYSKKKIIIAIYIFIYILNATSLIFFSQMLGSNSSFLLISLTLILTLSFIFLIYTPKKIKNNYEIFSSIKTANIKYIITPVIKRLFFGSIITIGLVYSIIVYLEFDLNTTRIMNYGDNSSIAPTSLTTRIELLKNNLLIHLNYNPFYGNMRVDEYTTGKGTYAHSLPFSLLTHLGIIGLFLFAKIFYKIKEEKNNLLFNIEDKYLKNSLELYKKWFFFLIILIATVTTFFTWMVMWFVIGLISLPINRKIIKIL